MAGVNGELLSRYDTVMVRDSLVIAIMLTFTFASFIAVRHKAIRRGGYYSKSEIFSLVCLVATVVLVLVQCILCILVANWQYHHYGVKELGVDMNFELQNRFQIVGFTLFFTHNVSMWLLKLCYIGQFYGMASAFTRGRMALLHGTTALAVSGLLVTIFIFTLWVRPIQANWVRSMIPAAGTVSLRVKPLIIMTVFAILADFGIVTLSIFIVRSIELRRKAERIALGVIFLVGFFSITACLIRFGFLYYIGMPSNGKIRKTGWAVAWRQHLARIEVVFGTMAYGFIFGRIALRKFVLAIASITSKISGSTVHTTKDDCSSSIEREIAELKNDIQVVRGSIDDPERASGSRYVERV